MNTDLTFITNADGSNLLERFKVLMWTLGRCEMKIIKRGEI